MIRFSLLFSSICSLFVLSWVLTRWYGPENCINSTLVGKVVINAGVSQVNQCTPIIRLLEGSPVAIIQNTHLLSRLNNLQSLAPFLDHQDTAITLSINTLSSHELSFQSDIIHISEAQLRLPGVLERAILFLKLNNNNPLSASAAADFLWDEFKIKKPDLSPQPWMGLVHSLNRYCRSSNVLLLHFEFCGTHNELNDSYISDGESRPVPWGLAPIYTQVLKDLYRSANLRGKQQIMSNLIFLGEIEDAYIEDIANTKSIISYEESFANMVSDWVMPLMVDQTSVGQATSKYSLSASAKFNYIYVGRSARDVFPIDFSADSSTSFNSSARLSEKYIVQLGQSQYFYPSEIAVKMPRADIFKDLKVQNVIYVSCDIPEVESLLEFDGFAERVLYIRQCEENEIDWNAVVRIGLNEYLKSNANVEFVEFNISAIKLAKKVRGPLQDPDDFLAWQRWLLWQKIVSDDGPQVQRPLSAIDGVRRFRIF